MFFLETRDNLYLYTYFYAYHIYNGCGGINPTCISESGGGRILPKNGAPKNFATASQLGESK